MEERRFAGYGIVEFADNTKCQLKEIAERLTPRLDSIIDSWVETQWQTWQPPGLGHEDLAQTFGSLFGSMLRRMQHEELEECLEDLESAGHDLARRNFPFRALIISIHFLEASYLPYLLSAGREQAQEWLIAMDEFLHFALAAIATSYFEENRLELLDRAEVGRIVQEGLLADIPRRTEDLEIAHVYVSARERAQLGGDFLDFFRLDRRGVAFIIGDLSGHGLEAVADSVKLRSLFRGFMREEPDPARAMDRTNRVLMAELRHDQFATALAVVYDASGRLSLVSAGNPQPIVCEDECRLVDVVGEALGVTPEASYKVDTVAMPPGATFVAFTDGLIEAGGGRNLFSEARALNAVADMRGAPVRAIAEHLIDESLRHAGGKFADDVAVLVLRRVKEGS